MKLYEKICDAELTRKINIGEKAAFQELFERYAPRIYQFSLSYLKNKADAEELVQDVFLKVWEKRQILDPSYNIKAFIFKIAINAIYDFIRRKNIEHAFNDFVLANRAENANPTWHMVIYEEMLANLNKLIAQMPKKQQHIFRMSKLDGLCNDEIAIRLDVSKRTVENHLYRAISFLKKHFKDESLFSLLFFYVVCG